MSNDEFKILQKALEAHISDADERKSLQKLLKQIEKKQQKLDFLRTREHQEKSIVSQLLAKTSEDLGDALDQAHEANRAKSAFLANMSHELRTPLNAIIGYTEMMINGIYGELNEKQSDRLQRVTDNSHHLLGLINDILDLSKIEAGKMEFIVDSFKIEAVISSPIDSAYGMSLKNNNELVVIKPDNLGSMTSDATRVRQILANLLSNACKFTENGKITLEIRAAEDQIDFIISDTGIGMSPEQSAQIFDEFVQVDNSSTRRYQGTGLGLAITRHLCQMLGGKISVKSVVGEGSIFTVNLPRSYIPENTIN